MDSKKTIGFKIVNNGVEKIFKFSIPPESMTVKQPQRVSRTKTFGGIVEEDYGADNPIINISGTTAGKRLRQVLSTYGKITDGYGEIMLLYDYFIRYKQFYSVNNVKDVKIYFYDYSHDDVTDAWEVSFDDFTIERSADKPHYYNYTMQLFCIARKGHIHIVSKDVATKDKAASAVGKIREFKNKAANIARKIRSTNLEIDKLKNNIFEVLTAAECLCDVVEAVFDVSKNASSVLYTPIRGVQDLIDSYTDLASVLIRDTANEAMTAYATFFDAVQFPARQANKLVKSLLYVKRSFSCLKNDAAAFSEYNELAQNWHELTCACNEVCAYGKRVESRTKITIENIDGDIYDINSLKETPVLPGESISDVAFRIYGDVGKVWLILAFNDLDDLQELEAGKILIVPSNDSCVIEGNPVYDDTFSDNYGSDVRSDFLVNDNDFALVRGRDNVMQAISLRLNTGKGSIKRNSEYGLPSLHNKTVGEVKNEIKEAVLSDIRISSVNDVSVRIDADLSSYSITTVLKDNVQTTIGGFIK